MDSALAGALSEGGTAAGEEGSQLPQLAIPDHEQQAAIILFLAICFLLGVFTQVVLRRLPIPLTALLLIWGLIIGFMEARQVGWTYFSYGITYMRALSPVMVLQIFLPIIGFSSGFGFDPHLIRKNLIQVFLLAWPGVLVGSLMIGALAYATFGYGWSWVEAFLFGSMMSVTDPVAVIALLKEVGASAKLGIVIEGESLFNDGSGFVLFLIFREMAEGGTADPLGVFLLFLQLAIGGLAIGFAFGAAASFLLGFFQDAIGEIMLTLLTSYITYYVADHLCHTSGLLAVVGLGVTMSLLGSSRVTPTTREPMKLFWEMAEWIVNTILFIYVGIVVGIIIVGRGGETEAGGQIIQPRDWGITAWLYVVLQIARVAMIIMFWPAMLVTGYPPTWKDVAVMSWAGLRGIVGLVIGLVIYQDEAIPNFEFRTLCLFHVGIMACVTIVVNGATTAPLLRFLGMASNSPAKLQMLQKVYQDTEKLGSEYVREMVSQDPLGLPDLQAVMKQTRLDLHPVFKEALRSSTAVEVVARRGNIWGRTSTFQVSAAADAVLMDTRTRFLQAVKATFGEGFEKGYINDHQILDLRESMDVALDKVAQPLATWPYLMDHGCHIPRWLRLLGRYQTLPVLGRIVQRVLFARLSSHATMAGAFVYAFREAQKMMQDYLEYSDEAQDEASAAHQAAVHQVLQESANELSAATAFISGLSAAFPLVPRAVKTRQVATTILRREARYLGLLFSAGLLDPKEHTELSKLLESRIKQLDIHMFATEIPTIKDLLPTHALFSGLTLDQISKHVWRNVTAEVADVGDLLCKKGAPLTYVCIVLRGLVAYDNRGSTPPTGAVRGGTPPAGAARAATPPSPPAASTPRAAAQPTGVGRAIAESLEDEEATQEPATESEKLHNILKVVLKEPDLPPAAPLQPPGDAVGLVELLTEQQDFEMSAVAASPVEVLRIPAPTFLDMMEELPTLRQAAWVFVACSVFSTHKPPGFRDVGMDELEGMFGACLLQLAKPTELVVVLAGESYLVHGTLQLVRDKDGRWDELTGPAVIPSDGSTCTAKTACTVFHRRLPMLPSAHGSVRVRKAGSFTGPISGQAQLPAFKVATGSLDDNARLVKRHSSQASLGSQLYEGGWGNSDAYSPSATPRVRSVSQYRARRYSASGMTAGTAGATEEQYIARATPTALPPPGLPPPGSGSAFLEMPANNDGPVSLGSKRALPNIVE